jgi:hypothetical protein
MTGRRPLRWAALSLCAVVVGGLTLHGATGLVHRLNPFSHRSIDRTQPPLLQSIRTISQYHAAVGTFQVIVDVEDDVKYVPQILAGRRTLFVAAGTVDAYVDLSGLPGNAMTISPDRRSVRLRLPAPMLGKPNLDPERSYVFDQRRGLADRLTDLVGSPADQHEFYVVAERRISEAAAASSLSSQATDNTRAMLTSFLASLGFTATFTSL